MYLNKKRQLFRLALLVMPGYAALSFALFSQVFTDSEAHKQLTPFW